jgi:hypothetical protein
MEKAFRTVIIQFNRKGQAVEIMSAIRDGVGGKGQQFSKQSQPQCRTREKPKKEPSPRCGQEKIS